VGGIADRPSLARISLFALTWHFCVWFGWALVAFSVYRVVPAVQQLPVSFWVVAGLALFGELRPVRTSGFFDPQGTVTSTGYVFAILYLWGLWPAVVVQAAATVLSELQKRKPPWKLFFNVGQYALSIGSAALVMYAVGLAGGLTAADRGLMGADLRWIVVTWVVWFLVNNALVSGLAADGGATFWQDFTEDFWFYVVTTAAVLALSPLIVLAASASPWYIPLLLIPMFAVHKAAKLSLVEQHQAMHDPLTGLPNRKYLNRTLDEAINSPGREPFALAILDLDRFKEVNDTLGHAVGDRLLALVAKRIRGALRPGDTVARLGGDEFALHLTGVDGHDHAAQVAERIRSALTEPFHLEDVVLELEASIGISYFPDHGSDVQVLMQRADVAMYLAKGTQTDIEVYDLARDHNSTDRLGLLAALRRAIEGGELELHYQPKVDLTTEAVVGVEALVRWNHPVRGFIPPDEFIPLAETSGLMHQLTEFVLTTALDQAAAWRRDGMPVSVAVNVSARDLHGSELVETLRRALARTGLPADLLKLELTERTLMAQHSRVSETIAGLEDLGVALSLDDFGTGYSSMFMLKRLPVSELKVDRSFVSRVSDGGEDRSIVRTIIDLAHALGLQAVGEGVETREMWEALAELGCDSAQGWLIARPMPAGEATTWLRQRELDFPFDGSGSSLGWGRVRTPH